MLREEQQVDEERAPPEVELAHRFAVVPAGPLRPPEVHGGDDREQRAGHQHIVEVRDDEIGVVVLEVGRHHREHQAREAADREQDDEAIAHSIGVSNVIEPFHIVETQLNTFTPVGTTIIIVGGT